jgi:4-diphosphocytidyl-2-C-methyl-D-erythritol kinase
MICFPNAKINLGLNVLGKRADGYHNIETVFYPIPLCDVLEVVEAEAFSFAQTGIPIDAPAKDNLVVKAMRLLSAYELPPLEVHLYKAIPSGAGLGGGSSNAAYMLKLLNDFGKLGLGEDELERMASRLGADCPFFIRNRPVFASGTGNVFETLSLSLKGFHLCLVTPSGLAISTAEAYAALRPQPPSVSLRETVYLPAREWKGWMTNDFEQSLFGRYPELAAIKQSLYNAGAVYASMSGSGSSIFGLFETPVSQEALHTRLSGAKWFVL